MIPTKTHRGHTLHLASPSSMRTFAGDQYVWACEDGVLLLTEEEAQRYGVNPFRGIPIRPLR